MKRGENGKAFKLKEHGTNVKTEIIAGITTFLAMAYILAVNPAYLGAIDRATKGQSLPLQRFRRQLLRCVWRFLRTTRLRLLRGWG